MVPDTLSPAVAIALNLDLITTLFVGGSASWISYLAYSFSREKARIELFQMRWELYEQTLIFCSRVIQDGEVVGQTEREERILDVSVHELAQKSFRGKGLHKARALFDEDIFNLFKTLNDSYSWLTTYSKAPLDLDQQDWSQKKYEHIGRIWETIEIMPDAFKAYMYFGHIKNNKTFKLCY